MAKVEDLSRLETDLPVIASVDDVMARASNDKPMIEHVIITPAGAEAMLALNENNRRLKPVRVAKHVQTLDAGLWLLTNDAIALDRNGVVSNGQHRLGACVESGRTIEVFLYSGGDPKIRGVIDTGAKRSLADALMMSGQRSYTHGIAAAASLHYRYTNRQLSLQAKGHSLRDRPSHDIMLQYIEQHPEIVESAPEGMSTYLLMRAFHASSATTFIAITRKIDEAASTEFIEKLKSGEGLTQGDPVLALRRAYERAYVNASTIYGQRRSEWSLAVALKTWNHVRRGNIVSQVSVRTTEVYPEAV